MASKTQGKARAQQFDTKSSNNKKAAYCSIKIVGFQSLFCYFFHFFSNTVNISDVTELTNLGMKTHLQSTF